MKLNFFFFSEITEKNLEFIKSFEKGSLREWIKINLYRMFGLFWIIVIPLIIIEYYGIKYKIWKLKREKAEYFI